MDSPAPWWQGKNDKRWKFPRFSPVSEEGTTKVTKQHETRSPWGILWLFQNAETSTT
jgi:hypothetical protein